MSAPSQFGPPPPSSGGGISKLLVVVLVILGVLALGCCVLCSGCMYMARATAKVAQKAAEEGINHFLLQPPYLTALGAVLADERVQERLGEPIEAIHTPITLYRRSGSGPLKPAGETLQFDIKGPRGTAIVSIVATASDPQKVQYHAATITVTFSDGSVLDIEPPADQGVTPSETPAKGEADGSK